jgi:hypothetical protein
MDRLYIGYVEISPAMEQKLMKKHGVTAEEVRDACQAPNRYRDARWHRHPVYGGRLLVRGSTREGRKLKIVLQPIDLVDGTWRLRTAYVATR